MEAFILRLFRQENKVNYIEIHYIYFYIYKYNLYLNTLF